MPDIQDSSLEFTHEHGVEILQADLASQFIWHMMSLHDQNLLYPNTFIQCMSLFKGISCAYHKSRGMAGKMNR